jgi:hypothetical protein
VPLCPADAAGCSDVAVVGPDLVGIIAPIVVALVVIAIFVYFARRRRR